MAGKDILVACHNDKVHAPLSAYFHHAPDTPAPFVAEYVDPATGTRAWGDIPPSSKDIIWTENCPIYLPFGSGAPIHYQGGMSIFKELLEDGWTILRPGGVIVIPIKPSRLTQIGVDIVFKNFETALRSSPDVTHPWRASLVLPSDLPFILAKDGQQGKPVAFVILTKSAGGRRRTKSTRRKVRVPRSRKGSRPSTRASPRR